MRHSNDHWTLFFFIDRLIEQSDAYAHIKNNEDERKSSRYFGLQAIKYNVILFICAAIIAGLAIGAFIFFSSKVWASIIMIILAIAFLPITGVIFVLALNCDIKQMKLNKQAIGLVSLLFTLLILIALIVAVVVAVLVI